MGQTLPVIPVKTSDKRTRDVEQKRSGAIRSQRVSRHAEILSSVRELEVGQVELRPEAVRDASTLQVCEAEKIYMFY